MELFSHKEIKNILQRPELPRASLISAESAGKIPEATRVKRGKVNARKWRISDIPMIGKSYGKYPAPAGQKVISFFTGKGGVLKSTLAFNFGRTMALHGIRTILIGLDIQESITTLALGKPQCDDPKTAEKPLGLYRFFRDDLPLDGIIKKTDVPTLDILPETFELNLLEKSLRIQTKREGLFKRKLLPLLGDYELVIFDNSPNWNLLIENSLVASSIIVAPISCEIGTYQALDQNLKTLFEFKEEMGIDWADYIMVPTLLENNKVSKQILGLYLAEYEDQVTNGTIRRTVKGQESMAMKQSIFEYSGNSPLASDFDSLFIELWERINNGEE